MRSAADGADLGYDGHHKGVIESSLAGFTDEPMGPRRGQVPPYGFDIESQLRRDSLLRNAAQPETKDFLNFQQRDLAICHVPSRPLLGPGSHSAWVTQRGGILLKMSRQKGGILLKKSG